MRELARNKFRLRITLLIIWISFTLALTCWWVYFGINHLAEIASIDHEKTGSILKYQKMLLWEGGTLLLMLLGGGATIGFYMLKERKQKEKLKEFLAVFSHELKTPISSLRLDIDSVQDPNLSDTDKNRAIKRIGVVSEKLAMQLENSLHLADVDSKILLDEKISLSDLLNSASLPLDTIKIECPRDAVLRGDYRVLHSIFSNLLHNSYTHGKAGNIKFNVEESAKGLIHIDVEDDGIGFSGDASKLGTLFYRHTKQSGSGLGLYLLKRLTLRLGGKVQFCSGAKGFKVSLDLPGVMA